MSNNTPAITQPSTALAIAPEQTNWTENQVATLRHLGVDQAGDADLGVFFHQCARTGLDPFTRQIYMIGRWSREGTKYTIQTGIDGFRLIGRRAAAAARETISLEAPQWADQNGQWHGVWSNQWGTPLAARITIHRNGQPFTAVALFDEYAQTKKDGNLTQMWAQRPAGQIAKCAESLVWRMAFPQDLSGLYTTEEMAQAEDSVVVQQQPAPAPKPEAPAVVPAAVEDGYIGLAEKAETVEAVREVWTEAVAHGAMTDRVKASLLARVDTLNAAPAPAADESDDTVDGEIVEDETPGYEPPAGIDPFGPDGNQA